MRPSFNSSSRLLAAAASAVFAVGGSLFPLSLPDSPSANAEPGSSAVRAVPVLREAPAYDGPNYGPANDAPVPHEVLRPHSPDAAERWWLDCMVGMPHSADAAERAAAECW